MEKFRTNPLNNDLIVCCRDGTEIHIGRSGNGNAPDNQGGQHTNCSTTWYRIKGEGPYMPFGHRSTVRLFELITISNSPEEFEQLLEID